ncbi:MAG: hypothetical protein EBY21_02810 [Alphaproteobacteria bacterium]|nr:hypothetical protein [Alphaproteobacteria bacterium]
MMAKRALIGLAITTSLSLAALTHASAQQGDFYAGKTIDLFIGYEGGAGYDIYARLLGEHMGRFLPGHPTILPRNMPGAASMRVMTYLQQVAKKDGTAWGAVDRNVAVEPLLYGENSVAPFKTPLDYPWIGSLTTEIGIAAVWHTTGITSWKDTLNRPTIVAMAGPQGGIGARVLNSILGTQFRQVCCYGSDANQNLAMERGEVEGRVGASWSTFKTASGHWISGGQVRLIMQVGLEKSPDIPSEIPLVMDLTQTEKDRDALKIVFANQSLGRPFLLPPGTPPERVAEIRKAFSAMIKDPEFLADAAKRKLEIESPKSGSEIEAILKEVYSATPEAIALARRSIKDGEFKMKDEPKK